jgi:ParB-like chromosome segregation protein Spo0J
MVLSIAESPPELPEHPVVSPKSVISRKIALKELCDNLIVEGQRDPLVVYQDDEPTDLARPYILIAGHRRHAAMQILADKNTPNFTRDMQVTARAIEGGTKADYLLLSVSDNLFHEPLVRLLPIF